ncbi:MULTISPECIES: hypothetical protein [Clostridium]|uniref:hypothetical protein n=1 Tax=Clostridium TaxID=1485 RepID=UPI0007734072|nr:MULTISPECIES: hypothetical protein [Clostridium]AUM96356.1 hypothetical protein RSJ11_14860 [Clostridium sporogenes]AVQ53808.1 hypothetical protein C7M59_13460 [Clostridium botulinum]
MEPTVLTPKQLAERWQTCLTKIYEDNNAGKLPHLKTNKNRFPLAVIEEMEKETLFNKYDIKTPRERRLEKESEEWKFKYETLKNCINNALPELLKTMNL